MNNKYLLLFIFFFLIVSASSLDLDSKTYINEFSDEDETCSVKDGFIYTTSMEEFSVVSIYQCCGKNGCIYLPFDLKNKKEYNQTDLEEIFSIFHIREQIKLGNINTQFFVPPTTDVCSYFSGKDKEQMLNLAGEKSKYITTHLPKNYAKSVNLIKKVGYSTGILGEFEIGVFAVGVACGKMSDSEEEVFQKVGEFYSKIKVIETGTTYYGIINDVFTANTEARIKLEKVLNNWFHKLKNIGSEGVRLVKTGWNSLKNLFNEEKVEVEIPETTYKVLKEFNDRMVLDYSYLTYDASDLGQRTIKRFENKRNDTILKKNLLEINLSEYREEIPSLFIEGINNFLLTPNEHYSSERVEFNQAEKSLKEMDKNIELHKYNSALNLEQSITNNIEEIKISLESKKSLEKKIDYFNIILTLAIIYLITILTKILRKNSEKIIKFLDDFVFSL